MRNIWSIVTLNPFEISKQFLLLKSNLIFYLEGIERIFLKYRLFLPLGAIAQMYLKLGFFIKIIHKYQFIKMILRQHHWKLNSASSDMQNMSLGAHLSILPNTKEYLSRETSPGWGCRSEKGSLKSGIS